MLEPTFGSVSVSSGHNRSNAVWHVNLRRICSSVTRHVQSSQMECQFGPPHLLQYMYPSPLFQLNCSTSTASVQWQIAVGLSQSKCMLLLFQAAHRVDQAPTSMTVSAWFNLSVTILGRNRSPLKIACGELSHDFGPGSNFLRMHMGMTPAEVQALMGDDIAAIELQLINSSIHTCQPEHLPGLLMSTDPMISLISLEPRILLIENFMSAADCQRIIKLAEPDLHHSRVAKGDMTPSRTSCSTFLTHQKAFHPDIQSFEGRVSELISLPAVMTGRHQLYKSEAVQVVRYQCGEFYAEHFDNKADDCSKRACTVMAYLSDVEAGGETYFRRSTGYASNILGIHNTASSLHPSGPPVSGPTSGQAPAGLRIKPKQGRAIMFWSRMANGQEDRASLHSGEAVDKGEKWIASRWLKEDYTNPQICVEE